jgi:hypothetical protein
LQVFKNKKPNASDSDIIEDAIYSLSGRALKFYRINKDSIITFDDFKNQFKDEFGIKIDLQSAHSNLSSLKQSKTETIREFILEIKEAGQILAQVDNNMTSPVIESLMRSSFVNGLIQPFQEKVFDRRFTTFKEACDYALAIECNPRLKDKESPLTTRTFAVHMQGIEQNIKNAVASSALQQIPQQTDVSAVNYSQQAPPICQLCNKVGHSANSCFHLNNFQNNKMNNFQSNFHGQYRPPFNNSYNNYQPRNNNSYRPKNKTNYYGHGHNNYNNRGPYNNFNNSWRHNYNQNNAPKQSTSSNVALLATAAVPVGIAAQADNSVAPQPPSQAQQ